MRILVTRPSGDAEALAAVLRSRGHDPVLSPAMEIRLLPGADISLAGVQAILATSANGIRALSPRTRERALPVFAVGPRTAAAAQDVHFANVVEGSGDAAALALTVIDSLDPAAGALLHAAGRERTGELVRRLQATGFSLRVEALYEAVPLPRLSPAAADALRAGEIDAVLFFSPRSARLFADQVTAAQLAEHCGAVTAFCISRTTAEAAAALPFAAIRTASAPNQDAMLALLSSPCSPRARR
jgi:uroporphyrinogen-III synthase